ncbi:peroxiredoxin family protein [Desulfosoma sp.]|uniref:TlpA family protein disulfide reductase n=1 Tax=Desulfacinum infernum TaxID=35837 RepID=A0A831ZXK2_9BACT
MKRNRRRGVLGLGLAMLLALPGVAPAQSFVDKVMSLVGSQGSRVADFDLPSTDGQRVRLSDYRGKKPVLLYFWAIWCPSCQAVKPEVVKLRKQTREEQLEILAVNVGSGDSFERVQRYQNAHPMPVKVLYDGDGEAMKVFEVRGVPLFVLVDKDGAIVYRDHQLPSDIRRFIQ